MNMTTKWEIVSRAQNRVKDIPSALGSPQIVEFTEDVAHFAENITGQSIDLTDIGSQWHGVLTNGTCAQILGYMNGVGVSYTAGRLTINKQTELSGQEVQMKFLTDMVNADLAAIGRPIRHDKTNPTD